MDIVKELTGSTTKKKPSTKSRIKAALKLLSRNGYKRTVMYVTKGRRQYKMYGGFRKKSYSRKRWF